MHTLKEYIPSVVILLVTFLVALLLASVANAKFIEIERHRLHRMDPKPTQVIIDMLQTRDLIKYLRDNGWVREGVTDEDLENYILLVQQNCEGRTYVTPQLILAMIAVESHFDADAYSSCTCGLMQLSYLYHRGRLMTFNNGECSGLGDFYNPALNIATGVDYIEDIFAETMTYDSVPDKQAFSLMWYNQGALSASNTYAKGIVSDYAKMITRLSDELGHILSKGDVYRAPSESYQT